MNFVIWKLILKGSFYIKQLLMRENSKDFLTVGNMQNAVKLLHLKGKIAFRGSTIGVLALPWEHFRRIKSNSHTPIVTIVKRNGN